jgi:Family of unknown function (DUF6353)
MQLIPMAVSKALGRRALVVEKNSPAILFGAGLVGMVGSTVLACRATLKLEEVLDEGKVNLNKAKTLEHREYSEQDRQKDISIIYVQTSMKVVRLYAPSVAVGTAAVAALVQSHSILTRRNLALTAAYAALEKGFAEYRQRVVEKYGEEEDRNFRYGTREVEVIKDGKKKTIVRVGEGEPSIYARFFDPLSTEWSKEPEYNLIFLKCQQNYVNDLLRARGHVFLNEVYDKLGIPRSKAGSVVGWILIGDVRDNFIDFGVWDDQGTVRDFVNGREASILLDFNVDGVIYDKIDTPTEAISWQMRN